MSTTAAAADLTNWMRRQQSVNTLDTARQVTALWRHVDAANVDRTWPAITDALAHVVLTQHSKAATVAEAYVTRHAQLHGIIPNLLRASPLPALQVLTSLTVTGPVAVKRAAHAGMLANMAGRSALVQLVGSTSRLALLGARDTILKSAAASPRITGWQRVSGGECCDWCEMLVGRGAEDTASGEWHDHCVCTAEPVYS